MFLHPSAPVVQSFDGYLYRLVILVLSGPGTAFPIVYPIITYLLMVSQAIALNAMVNNQKLLQKPNYLTAMSYILITSVFSEWYNLSPPLIINSILIGVLSQLCKLHNHPQPKSILFNLGIAIGVSGFLYYPALSFLSLIVVGLTITRPFKIREWLIMLLGVCTPYYFAAAWFIWAGKWEKVPLPFVKITIPHLRQSWLEYSGLILITIAVLIGLVFMQSNLRRQLVQTRKSWALVILYLLIAVLVPFINETRLFNYWILAAVPVSIIMAAAFLYPERKWFSVVIHWGLVILSIFVGYFIK